MTQPESGRTVVVGSLGDIPPGAGRTFAVDGRQVAVFRLRDGSLRALDGVCPHRGGPLADGLADDQVVVCPLHNYTFDLCTGVEVSGSGLAVPTFAVSTAGEDICITLQR